MNGPHQGAWVDTPHGEHCFHFQTEGTVRAHRTLQPMVWNNDWHLSASIGTIRLGRAAATFRKVTALTRDQPPSDLFDSGLGLQWQWHLRHGLVAFADAATKNYISTRFPSPRITGISGMFQPVVAKIPFNEFTATVKLAFLPGRLWESVPGWWSWEWTTGCYRSKKRKGFLLSQNKCINARGTGK